MQVLLVDELETLQTCWPLPQSATKSRAPLPPPKLAVAGPAPTTAKRELTRSTAPAMTALRASLAVTRNSLFRAAACQMKVNSSLTAGGILVNRVRIHHYTTRNSENIGSALAIQRPIVGPDLPRAMPGEYATGALGAVWTLSPWAVLKTLR